MDVIQAFLDRNLFGGLPSFRDLSSWERWIVFLKAVYGLPLNRKERRIFRKHTGRKYDPPPGGWPEVVCIVGRQSGKSRISALIAVYEAMVSRRQADGTTLWALLISQDQRNARRTLFEYATSAFEASEILRGTIVDKLRDTMRLRTGVTLACYPCRPESVRGLRAKVVVCDELAFFRTTDWRPVDREMIRALRPGLATTSGKLIVISSPYASTGMLWDLHRTHYGREGSKTLVWVATAPEMNPTLPADYLQRMEEEDPEAYRSEVLGEFRSGLSTLFDPDALDAAVVPDRKELPPLEGIRYRAFVDPSGGRSDLFTLAIGHQDGERGIVDLCRGWQPPLNPSGVVEEIAAILSDYRIGVATGDRYGGEWPRERFRAHGLTYALAEKPKSDLYLSLLSYVNSGRVELPDQPGLLQELRGLERRRGSSGRDRVDHRPGAHDDRANAVAGLAHLLLSRPKRVVRITRL